MLRHFSKVPKGDIVLFDRFGRWRRAVERWTTSHSNQPLFAVKMDERQLG
jgi:hypothetical protein